jgi:cell wall-associated NlpC family hydrolase
MRKKQTIEEVAKAAMTPHNEVNCSGYVRTVALDLGEYMPQMDANEMVRYLAGNHSWEQLGNNDQMASQLAAQGYLVIAGKTEPHDNGHVIILVPGRIRDYARGYWGSSRGVRYSGQDKGIDWAWHRGELHEVQFFAIRLPTLVNGQ